MNSAPLSTVEAKKMRDYSVAKSNELIIRSKYDLNVVEQRILACMISTLDSRPREKGGSDKDVLAGELSIDTICELCNVEKRGSSKYISALAKNIRDRSFWFETSKGEYETISWLDKVKYSENKGIIYFVFSSDVKSYLLNLDEDFTTYKLPMVLRFDSRYTNLIYDLIQAKFGRSYKVPSSLVMSVDEIRQRVQVERMDKKTNKLKIVNQNINFKDIRTKILEPAVKEINMYTDIIVDLSYVKKGRKVDTIQFTFRAKTKDEMSEIPPFIEKAARQEEEASG